MKALVYVNGKKHSAWDSVREAKQQAKTLKNYGYRGVTIHTIDHNYQNGHYFV